MVVKDGFYYAVPLPRALTEDVHGSILEVINIISIPY
jgi:hypothetical protein